MHHHKEFKIQRLEELYSPLLFVGFSTSWYEFMFTKRLKNRVIKVLTSCDVAIVYKKDGHTMVIYDNVEDM